MQRFASHLLVGQAVCLSGKCLYAFQQTISASRPKDSGAVRAVSTNTLLTCARAAPERLVLKAWVMRCPHMHVIGNNRGERHQCCQLSRYCKCSLCKCKSNCTAKSARLRDLAQCNREAAVTTGLQVRLFAGSQVRNRLCVGLTSRAFRSQ